MSIQRLLKRGSTAVTITPLLRGGRSGKADAMGWLLASDVAAVVGRRRRTAVVVVLGYDSVAGGL
ncbi:hypothetical protein [Gaiella sp.]|uniref:hypothetical protein n=1 Tax=Gaiella sp. TaxID=2663207 RepID=UPI003263343A